MLVAFPTVPLAVTLTVSTLAVVTFDATVPAAWPV